MLAFTMLIAAFGIIVWCLATPSADPDQYAGAGVLFLLAVLAGIIFLLAYRLEADSNENKKLKSQLRNTQDVLEEARTELRFCNQQLISNLNATTT